MMIFYQLTNVFIVNLNVLENLITEIKGLEHLINLHTLYLQHNKIREIKGLETLINLQYLNLNDNPIREDERYLLGKSAQEIVKYCQEKVKKAKEGD